MADKRSSLPESTEESRAKARALAVKARKARADFKDDIHAGKYTLKQAVAKARKNKTLQRMTVKELLRSFVGMGPKKVEQAMTEARISQTRRISGLTDNQLERLQVWFSSRVRR